MVVVLRRAAGDAAGGAGAVLGVWCGRGWRRGMRRRRLGSAEGARRWFREAGGVKGNGPGPVSGRYLSLADREEIAVGLARGESYRRIGARLDPPRPASTVSREVARNGPRGAVPGGAGAGAGRGAGAAAEDG